MQTIPVYISLLIPPDGAAYHLNVDLKSISTRADASLTAFNTGKVLSMIFSQTDPHRRQNGQPSVVKQFQLSFYC